MLWRMIRSKPSVPHDIVRAEFGAPPMLVEAHFKTVCFIHKFRELGRDRLSYRAFEASRQFAKAEGISWYFAMTQWLSEHGFDIECLPPFQIPHTPASHIVRGIES